MGLPKRDNFRENQDCKVLSWSLVGDGGGGVGLPDLGWEPPRDLGWSLLGLLAKIKGRSRLGLLYHDLVVIVGLSCPIIT